MKRITSQKRPSAYPTGSLFSAVTGYFTFAFGATQVEKEYSDVLTGDTTAQQVRNLTDLLSGDVDNTGTVQLTLRYDAQRMAADLLGDRQGSVVVIEPETGAIRAMYSSPTYDPNSFVTAPFEDAQATIEELQTAPGNPLLANAYQERYMPGSTFKLFTTSIGLEAGVIDTSTVWPEVREWVPPQTIDPIQNYHGTLCGGDMETVFARSCNIPFAQIAAELLGPEGMIDGLADWGFEEPLPIDADPFTYELEAPAPDEGEDRYRVEVLEGGKTVTITSYVYVRRPVGGGGCASAPGGTGGAALVWAGLLLAVGLARGRRRAR